MAKDAQAAERSGGQGCRGKQAETGMGGDGGEKGHPRPLGQQRSWASSAAQLSAALIADRVSVHLPAAFPL